jgi:hypothetical protein
MIRYLITEGQLQRKGNQSINKNYPKDLNLDGNVCLFSGEMNLYKL